MAASSVEAIIEKLDQQEAEVRTRYGWGPTIACPLCGDTGYLRDDLAHGRHDLCSCERGRAQAEALYRQETWPRQVPARFAGYSLESAPDQKAAAAVTNWLNTERWKQGANLFITGPVGTGKTGLAVGALRRLHFDGCRVMFHGVPALLDALRPHDGADDLLSRVQGGYVLGLDDLGVEKPSEWVQERLYLIVNGRYEAKRPTIFTTNCNLGALATRLGERTVSRMAEEITVITVDGNDQRRG